MVSQEDGPRLALRAATWRAAADEINGGFLPAGLYQTLLRHSEGKQFDSASAVRKQIDKDVHRTFGSVRGLRVPQQEALRSLRNVLLAYAEHNPQVGYTQSMNFIAAVLLLVVDEESAFWILTAIVERLMPGHFSSCMTMALIDQGVFLDFLRREDAELVAHLEGLSVAPSLVTTQWLLTCFVGSALPLGALLRIWDAFLDERHIAVLFRVASALLVSHRAALLAADDAGDAYRLLTTLGGELSEAEAIEALLHAADTLSARDELAPEPLTAARQRHAAKLEGERGLQASQIACAAVATATATASDLIQGLTPTPPPVAAAPPAEAGMAAPRPAHEWSIVPAAYSGGDAVLEGWNLVEPQHHEPPPPSQPAPPPAQPNSSLSYVILQHESPTVFEAHF